MNPTFLIEAVHTLTEATINKAIISPEAYLDPGSGSFVLQLVIAALLGGLFIIKGYWIKIKTFILGLFHKKEKTEEEEYV
jgi:hypothetical protein